MSSLQSAMNNSDLAALLGVEERKLTYLVYSKSFTPRYQRIFIQKRGGGVRPIDVPAPPIKILQSKLLPLLEELYMPHQAAYGFVRGRTIVDNARNHAGRKWVLRADLEDYFGSINFGRVWGLLQAKPYKLARKTATTIANLCVHNDRLPQGAPTSPILANMVTKPLDGALTKLASQTDCVYTRYADDITFSTWNSTFPDVLAEFHNSDTAVGRRLSQVIKRNGFKLNTAKLCLQSKSQRQMVTGLVVNEFVNVPREYVREVRAMLKSWEEDGLAEAEERFHKQDNKHRHPDASLPAFEEVMEGKLEFLRQVRGPNDALYVKLMLRLLVCKDEPQRAAQIEDAQRHLERSLWIVESENKDGSDCSQGTAVHVEGVGLVTCAHCVSDGPIEVFQHNGVSKKYRATVVESIRALDLAILEIKGLTRFPGSLRATHNQPFKRNQQITVLGFPNYQVGDEPYIAPGQVVSFRTRNTRRMAILSPSIVTGNSGGPVINDRQEVIGIASIGADSFDEAQATAHHGAIPINCLSHFKNVSW